jgi:hypothetical protein
VSSAEWMATYRQNLRDNDPESYLKMLKRERSRSRRAHRVKHERRLKELEGDPAGLARYLARRAAALRQWRTPKMRRSRHRLYNDSIAALEQFS